MSWNSGIKRVLAAAAAAVMICLLPGAGLAVRADYVNVLDDRVYNNEYLVIRKDPTGKVGKTMNVPIMIRAKDRDLDEVWVGFSNEINSFLYLPEDGGTDSSLRNEYPFEINEELFAPRKLGKMKEGNTKSITLTAQVRRDMKEGYYCIPIAIYPNGKDGSVEVDYMNIWIGAQTSSDTETSDDANTEDVIFALGENQNTPYGVFPNVMEFGVNVRNKSRMPAYDVTVSMVVGRSDDEFPFMITDGNYDRHFEEIDAGETVTAPYAMMIREDSYTGFYPIKFTISYRESIDGKKKVADGPGAVLNAQNGETQSTDTSVKTKEYEFYVHISSKEKEEEDKLGEFNENDRTKARIIVESFRTEPEKIMAGDEFTLILNMKNASTSVTASNILFTMEPEKVENASVFSTESGSSSLVVNSLGAGASTELKMKFLAKAGIDQRSYTMTIKEKFDSPEFKNAEETVTIDIPIYQRARFSTSTFEVMPDSIEVDGESNIMFGVNNTGRIPLYNVNVRFEGDSIRTTETYVGNIKPGETGNVDVMVAGTAPTEDDGKIKVIISYEDENGEVTETEKELTLYVTEPMDDFDPSMFEDFDDMDGMEAGASSGIAGWMADPSKRNLWIAGGVVIAVLAAAIAVILGKRHKRKKQKAEEEGLDDEIS